MKKFVSLLLTVMILFALCLPVSAANGTAITLDDARTYMDNYVHTFTYGCCVNIPANLSPIIFADLLINIDEVDVYFDTVSDISITDDTAILTPFDEEYIEPIASAIKINYPFFIIDTVSPSETDGARIILSLPEMTKDMRDACTNLLNSYFSHYKSKIELVEKLSETYILTHSENADDMATLKAVYNDNMQKMNTIKAEYAEYIRNRRAQYLKEHPEDADIYDAGIGSVFSEGSLTIIVGVVCGVIGFLTAMLIFKKKKTSGSASASENEN